MRLLRLSIDDKKEIVLDELKNRSGRMQEESISSFVDRLLSQYRYSKGADRYFWKAIRELEEEGKIDRCREGKRKHLILVEENDGSKGHKEPIFLEKWATTKRLESIKRFLLSWESYDFAGETRVAE